MSKKCRWMEKPAECTVGATIGRPAIWGQNCIAGGDCFCFLRKPQQFLCNCCAFGESPPQRYLTKLSKNGVIPSKRSASKNPHPAGERTGPSTRCARSGRQKKPEGLPHFSVILSKRSESKNPYFLADCHGAYAPRNDRKKLTGVVSNLLS